MKGLSPRNDDERAFMKTFYSLCYAHSRYQVWDDFVHMAAISIVNAVDKEHFAEREERYLAIAKRYTADQVQGFAKLFAITVKALENNPWQDFLGELYMRCDLGNETHGQFFTPYHICHMMAECSMTDDIPIQGIIEEKGYASVCDPCIGGGAMMIGAAEVLHKKGINYQQDVIFVGQDIDETVAMMAYIQLSLLGCPGYIKVGNSLTEPVTGEDPLFCDGKATTYVTPMFLTGKWHMRRVCRHMQALICSMPDSPVQSSDQAASSADLSARPPETPAEPPTVILKKPRRNQAEGQLMFDFGEVGA